jgi:ribosome-associated protein
MTPRNVSKKIAKLIYSKKGEEILILDVRKVANFVDYFVIATGTSDIHIKMLKDTIIEELEKLNISPLRTDGDKSPDWKVIDYGDIMVHLFTQEARKFYNLENLWSDGKKVSWKEKVKKDNE